MVVKGVSIETREQAISMLRQALLQGYDAPKADHTARLMESRAYETCKTFEEWNHHLERQHQAILLKFQERRAAQQQQQPMGFLPSQMPPYHQPYQAPFLPQQQQPQSQPMYSAPHPPPPSQYSRQQQGWGQPPPYGYQMMGSQPLPPSQYQQQMQWNGVSPQSHTSSATTVDVGVGEGGWGALQTQPQTQPQYQVAVQNTYPVQVHLPVSQALSPQAPLSEEVHQKALKDFCKLQLLARENLLKDFKEIADLMTASAAKAGLEPDQNAKTLLQAISYIELKDFSKLSISPARVSGFAALLKTAKAVAERVKNIAMQNRKNAAAATTAAAAVVAKEEIAAVKEDPTEKLLTILKDKTVVFPSSVAACLETQLEKARQQAFPLPTLAENK